MCGTMQSSSEQGDHGHQSESDDDDERKLKNSKLFAAIGKGKLEKVKSLLENGTKTDIIDRNNRDSSPLHYAVEKGKKEIVEELLNPNWGTNASLENNQGKTPLDIALDAVKKFSDIAQLLKNHQSEITVEGEKNVGSLAADSDYVRRNIDKKNAGENETPIENDNSLSTFQRTTGAAGIEGQLCEINLSILLLLKGTTDEQISRFHLASNLKKADKFDDIVFTCDYKSGKSKIIFLQAKHKAANALRGVNLNSLLSDSESGDFTLNKYFISYRKIRQYFLEKKEMRDPVFRGNFDDCEFLIYTNASFEYGQSKCIKEVKMDENDLLQINESQGKCFQLKFTSNLPEDKLKIFNLLKNSSDSTRLAKALAEAFSSANGLDIQKEIFQDYHKALQTNLLEITTNLKGKIKGNFLFGETQFCSLFLDEVGKSLKKPLDFVTQELQNKEINLSKKFWDENCGGFPDLPNDGLISETEVQDFLNKFKLYAYQPNEKELERAIKEIAKGFYKIEQQDVASVFPDVASQVRNWWQGENYYLTKEHKFFETAARVSVQFDIKEPVALFTGRVQELVDLHSFLQQSGQAVVSQMVSITGLGGVGKSEMARKYLRDYKNHYDNNVIWINAENFLTITDSFRRLAQDKLGISTTDENGRERSIHVLAEDVYNFFGKRHRKSLFIFDNAQKHKMIGDGQSAEGVDKFLPKGDFNKPSVLVTSRDQEWGEIQNLPLGVFTEEEAVEFIQKAFINVLEVEKTEAQKLARELDYLPLALRQAVAYISLENQGSTKWSKDKFTVNRYLELFTEHAELLLREGSSENRYSETVLTTWKVTVDKIKQKRQRGGHLALDMLNVIAYVAADNILVDEMFSELIRDEEERHSAVELLDQYSMVNLNSGNVSVHRMVQKVTRIQLENEGFKEAITAKTFKLLRDSFPYGQDKLDDIARKRRLLPHFEAFLRHIDDWLKKSPEDEKKIETDYLKRLLILMSHGYDFDPHRGKLLLERALPIVEKLYGSEDLEVAKILINLGSTYANLGDVPGQKILLERALEIKKKQYDDNHIELMIPIVNLGNAYGQLGDKIQQITLYEKAVAVQKNCEKIDYVQLAKTLTNLGLAKIESGNPQEGKDLLTQALAIETEYYESDHHELAFTLASFR